MKGKPVGSVSEVFRKDMKPKLENPYGATEKYPANAVCPECGAVLLKGNWTWSSPEKGSETHSKLCPACRQIKDDYASGVLTLSGGFLREHRREILDRIAKVAEDVKREHPLQRIMTIRDDGEEVEVRVTSEHLVRRLGKTLKRDFHGELTVTFAKSEKLARGRWRRER